MTETRVTRHISVNVNDDDTRNRADLYTRADGVVIGYRTDEDGTQTVLRDDVLTALHEAHASVDAE